MNLDDIHKVYFIGIGGIGMSALARYFHGLSKEVSGYDRVSTVLTRELEVEGIGVVYDENTDRIPKDVDLVVFTPAVPSNHAELQWYRDHDYKVHKRAEVLGWITNQTYNISVGGTHGKTTTSSMIAHILQFAKVDCTAFVGGITRNYGSNLLTSKDNTRTLVEADEFDRSFLTLHPDIAVITSMDADHLDIYGSHDYMVESFGLFAKQVTDGGLLIYKKGLPVSFENSIRSWTYSVDEVADYYASGITVDSGSYVFNVVGPNGQLDSMRLPLPGRHNVENAVAAIAVAHECGVEDNLIRSALGEYQGVKRRFEYVVREQDLVMIDDYAHHPTELTATISAVRELYPSRRITGVFQPHLYSRTRDFENEFADSLGLLDELILLDIYPAREQPIPGVTSANLLDKVELSAKELCSKETLVEHLREHDLEVLLLLGAGDIDTLILPVKEMLLERRAEV